MHANSDVGCLLHSIAHRSTAQHSTAQHSTAQHSTAQHSTAQHGIEQHWQCIAQLCHAEVTLTGNSMLPAFSGCSCRAVCALFNFISECTAYLFCRWLMNFSKASLSALPNCSFFWKAWCNTVSSCNFISNRADTMSLSYNTSLAFDRWRDEGQSQSRERGHWFYLW